MDQRIAEANIVYSNAGAASSKGSHPLNFHKRKMDFCPSLYKWGYLAPGSGEGLYLSNILLRNMKPVYGRNQKIQRQWTKF